MDLVDIVLALFFFWITGWIVHKIMGCDGNSLHFIFIGSAGSGLVAFLGWVTNPFTGAIGLCIVCALLVEYTVRNAKHKLWARDMHKRGWLTQEDIDGELHIVPDNLKGY